MEVSTVTSYGFKCKSASRLTKADTSREVTIAEEREASRVDITVEETPLATYRFDETRSKPVLYPIYAPTGSRVTRGFPVDPHVGERIDHPHHVGHWFAFGNVNGRDYWNTTSPRPSSDSNGWIRHGEIEEAVSGTPARLALRAEWLDARERVHLLETTRFVLAASEDRHVIDRQTTLEATERPVDLVDDKEGLVAIRVANELELPGEDEIEVISSVDNDAYRTHRVSGTANRSGTYLSSEGASGAGVWGTRGEWMRLSGTINGEDLSITMMDHPANPGAPTHWHARGYGLFAANPLGRAAFDEGTPPLQYTLDVGDSMTFTYRIAIDAGVPEPAALDERYRAFARSYD